MSALAPTTFGAMPGKKLYWIWFGPADPTAQQSELLVQVTDSS